MSLAGRPTHLDEVLKKEPLKQAEPERDPDDVQPPDLKGEYLAAGHFRGRSMPCLQLYFNAAERKANGKKKQQLQYHGLECDDAESGFADDGQSFSVVFVTSAARLRLTVRGRNLEKLFDLISYHKLAWIRSIDADRDIKGALPDDAQVITGITVEMVPEE